MTNPPLWPHQRTALRFVADRTAAMLAMDMGTGKTRVAVESLAGRGGRVLILCPKSVRATWARELPRWGYPHPVTVPKPPAKRAVAALTAENGALVLNYEAARSASLRPHIEATSWDTVILDESHRIKAPQGKASKMCSRLRATRRLCLTGTPMPHSPLDAFGQYRFLQPTLLGGSFTKFRARYARMVNRPGIPVPIVDGYRNLEELTARLAPMTYQCRADDVLDLPGFDHVTRLVELGDAELRAYTQMAQEMVADVESGVVTAANALDRLLKLQQITGGCLGGNRIGTAKAESLRELLDDLPPGEKVVTFCRFRADLDAVHDVCRKGRSTYELSGRENQLDDWKADDSGAVLAVQIQAGGVGISAVEARHCVYYSLGYSLGDYLQSLARVHRPGQKRRVMYYHLVAAGTVDEALYEALREKRDVITQVLDAMRSRLPMEMS